MGILRATADDKTALKMSVEEFHLVGGSGMYSALKRQGFRLRTKREGAVLYVWTERITAGERGRDFRRKAGG